MIYLVVKTESRMSKAVIKYRSTVCTCSALKKKIDPNKQIDKVME